MSVRRKIVDLAESWGLVIDDVASAIRPQWGVERRLARRQSDVLARYEGASTRRRLSGWRPSDSSANTEIKEAHWLLRARARELVRNNEYAARAVSVYQRNVIGAGIIPAFDRKRFKDLDELLKRHVDRQHIDASGRQNLYGLQSVGQRAITESGEVLFKREWRTRKEQRELRLPLPFQIKMLEADYLDPSVDGVLKNGNIAVQGVEHHPSGRPVAYHLFSEHPGDYTSALQAKSVRVPAKDVAHVYDIWRPGQARGITWFAPVMVRLRDFKEYQDVQLIRQKIAASFSVFVHQNNPDGTDKSHEDGLIETVRPGMIEYLAPGESVTFGAPPGADGYEPFANVTLHAIASGLDMSYESLTTDLRGVNFSSGRMGHLEFTRKLEMLQALMWLVQFCHPVERWFLEAAALEGHNIDGAIGTWTPPARDMIDPARELDAVERKILLGVSSRQAETRKLGRDPEDVLDEQRRDNEQARKLGLHRLETNTDRDREGAGVSNG